MKLLKRLFKYTFISTPKTMIERVEFNSDRIGILTVLFMMILVFLAMVGYLPTWSFIK